MSELDPEIPIYDLQPLGYWLDVSMAPLRFGALAAGVIALLALMVAVIGAYCVVSYVTSERRHEFAVRLAIGARPLDILGQELGRAALLGAVGALCSAPMIVAVTRFVPRMSTGTSGVLGTTAFGTLVVVLVTIVASVRPAIRAARSDPIHALRD